MTAARSQPATRSGGYPSTVGPTPPSPRPTKYQTNSGGPRNNARPQPPFPRRGGGGGSHELEKKGGGSEGGGGWHKALVSDCLPLAAPIGLSPLLILTLCGSERVLVVSTEGGGEGVGWDPPPPRVPLWSPPKADRKLLNVNPLGTEGAEADILAVSLKHWKGRGGGSRGGNPPPLLRCTAVLIHHKGGGGGLTLR